MAWSREDRDRLAEIWKEMLELANEAKRLIQVNGKKIDYERARSYWLGHILSGLGDECYMDRNNFKSFLESELGYDADNDSFEDDEEEEEEEEEEDCEEDDEKSTASEE